LLINDENANIILQKFFQDIQVEKGKKTLEEGEKWLKENAKKEGVVTTASGLQYKILKEGTGEKPLATDKISVHYHGTLIDGTVFDSSVERGQPVEFTVSGVIPGWTEALLLMPIGSKWEIYIPASLGYGERGAGGVIPGNATLIFQVELLSIVPVVEEKPENGKK
jgi:FKBP-type peptidyl-prolyl cis-trans isomerase FklB